MKKYFVMGAALMTVVAMTSCKSQESAYKKAYEKAKAQQTETTVTTPVEQSAPVAVTPVQPTTPAQDYSNVSVRTEQVTLVSGAGLKAYSVVVGSFSVQANATALQSKLAAQGYKAQIAKSPSNMFRVIAATFDDKASAAQSRETLRGTYADAWLLYQK